MESADLFGGKPAESILWNWFKYGRMGRRFIGSYTELKVNSIQSDYTNFVEQTQEMGNVVRDK